ncbi:hypothetical protein RB595_004030 [Gaeumannomyces hyphopodioides]
MASPDRAQSPIFHPEDEAELLAQGLLTPASNGRRRIHKRRLQSSSEESSANIPLTPISWGSDSDSTLFEVVPDALNSRETLLYLGFNEETASYLWHRWTHWDEESNGPRLDIDTGEFPKIELDEGTTFIGLALYHIEDLHVNAVTEDDQSWRSCMVACGISDGLQDDILDPFFKNIRMTESCLFWLIDTLQMRWRGLKSIQATSHERAHASRRQSTRPVAVSDNQPSGSTGNGESSRRSISGQMSSQVPWISSHTAMSDQAKLAGRNAPGFIHLWKGIDQARIKDLRDANGSIDNLESLLSGFPSDFARQLAYYFAVDRDVALMYALWAKNRDGVQSVVLVQISIRNSDIKSLSESEKLTTFYPSEEWKKLVWHCRRPKKLPTELRKFRLASLIIGTIARKPDLAYRNMESWNDIQARDVLMANSRPAVQYVFLEDENEIVSGNASTIQVFPITSEEFSRARTLITVMND